MVCYLWYKRGSYSGIFLKFFGSNQLRNNFKYTRIVTSLILGRHTKYVQGLFFSKSIKSYFIKFYKTFLAFANMVHCFKDQNKCFGGEFTWKNQFFNYEVVKSNLFKSNLKLWWNMCFFNLINFSQSFLSMSLTSKPSSHNLK